MTLKYLFVFSLMILVGSLSAQTFSDVYVISKEKKTLVPMQLNFRLESVSFFRNNEYKGDITDGYSLTGEMFRPKLTFSPNESLYLEVGGHFLKYHGRDEWGYVLPWFSARYSLSDKLQVVFGQLDQSWQHGLSEQLWEPERLYTDRPEEGLQFLYSITKLNVQAWISWEQFILKDDPFQEHFTAGISGGYELFSNSEISLSIPVQLLFYHKGGEIDQSPLPVQTHSNVATGWEMQVNTNGAFIQAIQLSGKWFGYKSVSNSNAYPYDQGHAYLMDVQMKGQHGTASLSYWNAFQFLAPKGREVYQSASINDNSITEQDRSILAAKYFWQKEIIKDARIAFQLDAYYDLINSDFSYSYGIFLLFNGDFFLHQF